MRNDVASIALAGLLLAGLVDRVQAIAVEDLPTSELPPTNESFFGSSFDWSFVYNYKGASAAAVDHYWILTAAHVADDGGSGSLIVDGETYTQQEVVLHSQASDPDGNATADIALVRYDKPFPGYYLLADTVPVGSEVVVCGYGYSGTVVSTAFSHYFTEDGTTHASRRWGTNKIGAEKTLSTTVPIMATSKGFDITISTTKPNSGKTTYEAGCNIYDSGGGMFYNAAGTWKLTGHMVARYGAGTYSGNFAVATTYYANWIKSVIVDYDTDMDGLPDWWETKYGSGATSMVATNDLDGDTFSNYEEWLADTVPTNGNSFLELIDYPGGTNVVFSSSSNRQYQVQYLANLTNSNWAVEVDWFAGSHPQTVQSVSTADSNRFYRVRAKLD